MPMAAPIMARDWPGLSERVKADFLIHKETKVTPTTRSPRATKAIP